MASSWQTGLSPRVRGNRIARDVVNAPYGSIPACAGEPTDTRGRSSAPSVYPRVCGGTSLPNLLGAAVGGLSPRVRGNPTCNAWPATGHRSIPACAGEPATASRGPARSWVYPRVCGGTTRSSYAMRSMGGLSPRVRGNRAVLYSGVHYAGSIPACAGEPTVCERPAMPVTVYPRVCGGTLIRTPVSRSARGLSPRVRGNLSELPALKWLGRSIPACAGEPSHTTHI